MRFAFDGSAASTGSACHAGRIELSRVLKATDVPPKVGRGAIRFNLGRYTTSDEIDSVSKRQWRLKALSAASVAPVCVLDADSNLVRRLVTSGAAQRAAAWACYHTELYSRDFRMA